ncbi:hypothetical protein AC249_AIPGENE2193 [Exaiptasia diaphana]|nr:hypothetical protein AC249_AIPGENE2193 [Exaiptasia diaphana]
MLVYTDGNLSTTNTRKRKTTLNANDNISLDMPPKRSKGITGNAQLPTVQTTDQRSKIAGSRTGQPKVLSYKGVITKCFPRPHFGCYELDGKVRVIAL